MPGERPMIPEFGVGIYGYLFDGINDETFGRIAQAIKAGALQISTKQ